MKRYTITCPKCQLILGVASAVSPNLCPGCLGILRLEHEPHTSGWGPPCLLTWRPSPFIPAGRIGPIA